MIYFQKTRFENEVEKQLTELAIRKYAIKRHTSLDWQSSSSDQGSEMLFFGHEGNKYLKFTRRRTFLEQRFPKLIIIVPTNDDLYYKIRFSLLTTMGIAFTAIVLLLMIVYFAIGNVKIEELAGMITFCLIFFLLIVLELKLTRRNIKKAIDKFTETASFEKTA